MAVRAAGNVVPSYNGNALTNYANQATLQAVVDSIDVTDFGSSAKEFLTGFAEWTIPLSGHWDPTLDGYLGPDAVTPGTARNGSIAFDDGTTTVTYTWTANAYLENFTVEANSPTEGITWSATLRLAGAPSRSSV